MADNSYAQLIDDFDKGIQVLEGETLTEYIKRMGGVDYDSKAHGGSVGIEVLFKKKDGGRVGYIHGGVTHADGRRGFFKGAEADARAGRASMSPGTSHSGGTRHGDTGTGHHPPVITPKKKPIGPIKDDTPPWYSPSTLINNPLLNFINPKSKLGLGLGIFKTIKNFQPTEEDIKISDLPSDNLRTEITKDQKKALGKQKMGYGLGLDGFDVDSIRERIEPLGNPDNPATNEEITTFFSADGGRVGFANGGSGNWWDGLEGEALSIYNSMNAYGASDAEIQSKLQGLELWSPDGISTGDEQVTGIINQNIGGGDGGGGGITNAYNVNQNLGPTNITDYEAEAYGIGPTWGGSWAKAKDTFSKIPTPLNLARMGINKFQDWREEQDKIAKQNLQAEIDAANKKAWEESQAKQSHEKGQWGGHGSVEAYDSSQQATYDRAVDRHRGAQGGLATMFTRRR